jgi:KaiC/GvpD/RAD55 family RecA-like ATPase
VTGYSSFGVGEIDDLLGGGLIPGSSYLLEIESGTEELAFIASFLDAGWRQQELCVVVTYDMPHQEIIKRLKQFVDAGEKMDSGALVIVDMFTDAKADSELSGQVFTTRNPRDFNTMRRISYELANEVPKRIQLGRFGGVRTVTYSLSSMIMNYKFEPSYKWTEAGLDLVRQSNVMTLTILNPKMFDESVVAAFEHLNDGIIVLGMEKLSDRYQRYIRVKRSPISGFVTKIVPYDIVDKRPHLHKQPD